MGQPTIADLAKSSGVSVSTVNRILSGSKTVRTSTIQHVLEAAEELGFYGLGAISSRKKESVPQYRFGFLLQQSKRDLYQLIGKKITAAASIRQDVNVKTVIDFVDDLEPENTAARLEKLGRKCDAVAIIAAVHPLVDQAIRSLKAQGTPIIAYITDQSAPERAGYVGADNWKLGRTAAWFIDHTTHGSGRVAVFIGNHRYQCQDISDASFRSYMRENAPHLHVGDSKLTNEDPDQAYRMVCDLLKKQDDLVGIYIAGGGISGVLDALRDMPTSRQRSVRVVCRDIGPETRKGLTEGLITAALCHPLPQISNMLLDTMLHTVQQAGNGSSLQRTIPFEIITPQNL